MTFLPAWAGLCGLLGWADLLATDLKKARAQPGKVAVTMVERVQSAQLLLQLGGYDPRGEIRWGEEGVCMCVCGERQERGKEQKKIVSKALDFGGYYCMNRCY